MQRKWLLALIGVVALMLSALPIVGARELHGHQGAPATSLNADNRLENASATEPSSGSGALSQFLPHGVCLLWDQSLLALHVVSDALIALAYYSIPIALLFFVRKRKDLAFSWIFVLFAIFIIACGTTHILGILMIWRPVYWLDGILKALTAAVSVVTAILLWPLIPKALALPSPAQLRAAYNELEEKNRLVERASRMKSEFLANMSHELRTPLNGIIGFTELMHDGKLGAVTSNHKEYLGDILSSAKHLLSLINDILDLAKVETGKIAFHPEPVQLSKIIGEVRDILRAIAVRKQVAIKIETDPEAEDLVLDPGKLKQVLYNYISNAIKFTNENGKVTVRASAEQGGLLRIEVEDNGIGIRSEDMDRLFVEFQQLDSTMTKKYAGTGLGLALTKKIVEAQGGCVGARSDYGHGSTFYAILPRLAPPMDEAGGNGELLTAWSVNPR